MRERLTYSNVVSTLCLFIVLGGTSYGLASGSIDSREIKNSTVRTRDLRNNDVRSVDIRDRGITTRDLAVNGVGGNAVNEASLGKVPVAALSENALALGGVPVGAFDRSVAATVDLEDNQGGTVMPAPGYGSLFVGAAASEVCDAGSEDVSLSWQNLSSGSQDLVVVAADSAGFDAPSALVLGPGDAAELAELSGPASLTDVVVRPSGVTAAQVRVTAHVAIGSDFGDGCRIAARAVESG